MNQQGTQASYHALFQCLTLPQRVEDTMGPAGRNPCVGLTIAIPRAETILSARD
jgi:hypothetical protein